MPVNTAITIRKGTASQWSSTNPVLASGEPGYDLSNNILKIGDGVSNWNSLSNHKHSSIDITNFNSSVSGLIPVKDIIAGTNINISSSSGTYTINSTGGGGTGLQSSSYIAQGKLSGNQSVASGGDAVIQFIDDYDPQAWFNSSTRRFQPNIAGYYLISVGAWLDDADTTNGQANAQIRLNGNTILITQNQLNDISGLSLTGSKVVYMNGTTDYVDFTFYHSAGSAKNLLSSGNGTWFTAVFLAWSGPPTGTQNYLSKFGSSGSGVIDSLIYDNGTNIGIGTLSPLYKLDVVGTGNFSQNLLVNGTGVSLSGHSHGNINSSGQIGSVANRVITTSDNGLLVANSDVQFECSSIFIGTGGDFITNGGMVLAPGAIIFSDNTVQETAYTGKIGSTANVPLITTASGIITSGTFGTTANTFCQGNDSRLSEEVVEYVATTNFPASGNSTLLYIATDASRSYRWTGSQYVEVGSSPSYVANHTHSASDITNFNSSVSGLLPVTSILAGSNVSVVASGTSYIISSSGTGGGSSIKLGTIMALS